jgi:hypothetical protein
MNTTKDMPSKFYEFVDNVLSRLISYQNGSLIYQDTYHFLKRKKNRDGTYSSNKVETNQQRIEELLYQEFRHSGLKRPKKSYTLNYNISENKYEHNFIKICVARILRNNKKIKTLFVKLGYQIIIPCLDLAELEVEQEQKVEDYKFFVKYYDKPYINSFEIPVKYHYLMREIYKSKVLISAMENLVITVLKFQDYDIKGTLSSILENKILTNLHSFRIGIQGLQALTSFSADIFINEQFMQVSDISNPKDEIPNDLDRSIALSHTNRSNHSDDVSDSSNKLSNNSMY